MTSKKNKKKKFTEKEDLNLIDLVSLYGDDWKTIASKMRNRNVRQCRERWRYYLDPSIKSVKWTKHDDELLLQKVEEYGKRWKIIEKFFPLRTYIAIKNRYATLSRHVEKKYVKKYPNENQDNSANIHSNQQSKQSFESEKEVEDFLSPYKSLFADYYDFLN